MLSPSFMLSLAIVCLATVSLAVGPIKVSIHPSFRCHPTMKFVPKDFKDLRKTITPEQPLLLLINSAEAPNNLDDYDAFSSDSEKALNDLFIDRTKLKQKENAEQQIMELRKLLEATKWQNFLNTLSGVKYLVSPHTESIQTALRTMPQVEFTIDEGLLERRLPTDPVLSADDENIESVQNLFKERSQIYEMKIYGSEKNDDQIGFFSDQDLKNELGRMETEQEFDGRIENWLNMLRPTDVETNSEQQLNETNADEEQLEEDQETEPCIPQVYVVFANSGFINSIIKRFRLKEFEHQNYQANFCEMIPIVLDFFAGSLPDQIERAETENRLYLTTRSFDDKHFNERIGAIANEHEL